MLTEAFTLVLQLPPLAFGPAMPPPAFATPRFLTCAIHDLGRLQEPPRPLITWKAALDPRSLRPAQQQFLVNQPVDILLLLAAAYAGRATWDETPWAARAWQSTGAVTPVLIPPMAPPTWSLGPR